MSSHIADSRCGLPPIMTVAEPFTMTSVGPTQMHMSPTLAAAGNDEGWTARRYYKTSHASAVTIGQVCISEIREAAGTKSLTGWRPFPDAQNTGTVGTVNGAGIDWTTGMHRNLPKISFERCKPSGRAV
jgi:hypothetical protein